MDPSTSSSLLSSPPPLPSPERAAAGAASSEITALLGPGTLFEGKLHFDGRVRIDGTFKGEIKSKDLLIIGEGADVQANIEVGTLIIRGGRVQGDIRARESLEVHAPGKIIGNIQSPSLFIERGVMFQGSCRMDPLEDEKAASKSVVAVPEKADKTDVKEKASKAAPQATLNGN